MPEPAENRIEIKEFPGLVQHSDTYDVQDGSAQELTNMECSTPGEMAVRKGFKEVLFDG